MPTIDEESQQAAAEPPAALSASALRVTAEQAKAEAMQAVEAARLATVAANSAQNKLIAADQGKRKATSLRKLAEQQAAFLAAKVKSNVEAANAERQAEQATIEAEAAGRRSERASSDAAAKAAELKQALASAQKAADTAHLSAEVHASAQRETATADGAAADAQRRLAEAEERAAVLADECVALDAEVKQAQKRVKGCRGQGKAWEDRTALALRKAEVNAAKGKTVCAAVAEEAAQAADEVSAKAEAARSAAEREIAAATFAETDRAGAAAAKEASVRVGNEAAAAKDEAAAAVKAATHAMEAKAEALAHTKAEAALKATDEEALARANEELHAARAGETTAEMTKGRFTMELEKVKRTLAKAEAHRAAKQAAADAKEKEAEMAEEAEQKAEEARRAAEEAAVRTAEEQERLREEAAEAAAAEAEAARLAALEQANEEAEVAIVEERRLVRTRPTAARRCVVAGPALKDAFRGLEANFSIEAYDTTSARQPDGGDDFFVCVRCCGQGTRVRAKVRDHNDGSYTVVFKPTTAGRLSIRVGQAHRSHPHTSRARPPPFTDRMPPHHATSTASQVSLMGEPLPGSPFQCVVNAPVAHAARCELSGAALSEITAHRQEHFAICYRDLLGQVAHAEELELSIQKEGVEESPVRRIWSPVSPESPEGPESTPGTPGTPGMPGSLRGLREAWSPQTSGQGPRRAGRAGKGRIGRLNVQARQEQQLRWSQRYALDSQRERLKAKDRQEELEAQQAELATSPRSPRGFGVSAGSPCSVMSPWMKELQADPSGIGLAYGGLYPGRLHARGKLVDSHKVSFSVGACGRYLLHVRMRYHSTPLPGSPFHLTVLPDRAHPLGTYIDPQSLPLRGPSTPMEGTGIGMVAGRKMSGLWSCTLRVLGRDKMGNPCKTGGATITCGCAQPEAEPQDDDEEAEPLVHSAIEDEGHGGYLCKWWSARPGQYLVFVKMDGLHVQGRWGRRTPRLPPTATAPRHGRQLRLVPSGRPVLATPDLRRPPRLGSLVYTARCSCDSARARASSQRAKLFRRRRRRLRASGHCLRNRSMTRRQHFQQGPPRRRSPRRH